MPESDTLDPTKPAGVAHVSMATWRETNVSLSQAIKKPSRTLIGHRFMKGRPTCSDGRFISFLTWTYSVFSNQLI